ncbi:hypothetical protein IKE96_00975, partial [bacterium]|nr:hypothetical protein [bacterium]
MLGPKDGKPIIAPTQDMVLGIYYISKEVKGGLGEGMIFYDQFEVRRALEEKKVGIHSLIGISTNVYAKKGFHEEGLDGILITTPGKVIFNDNLPEDFNYINSPKNINSI